MKKDKQKPKIIKREIITDQSDPRMVEFIKSRGGFGPSGKQKIVKLEITEYEPGPDKFKVTTKFGYYEGETPPKYKEFFLGLYQAASEKTKGDKKRRKPSG